MVNQVLDSSDKVKNIEGTSVCSQKGSPDSWKDYWLSKSGRQWPDKCQKNGCGDPPTDGAHVKIRGKPGTVYIIPLCDSCNHPDKSDWMPVNKNAKAVSVEKKDTTGPEGICYFSK